MSGRHRRIIAGLLLVGSLASTAGTASAAPASRADTIAAAKQATYERAVAAASAQLPGAVRIELVPLRAEHCQTYAEAVAASPVLADACRNGTFVKGGTRSHCIASAGLFVTNLPFSFYVASMGFFANCFNDSPLACFGVIAGAGAPPGGYGPGLPGDGGCFGGTTPWLSRKTQTYTAVVGLATLFGGTEIGFFSFSY